jgi:hypothetical protein
MRWNRRLLYSVISVVLTALAYSVIMAHDNAVAHPGTRFNGSAVIQTMQVVLLFSIPGWLIALPLVLLVRDFRGWRAWAWFVAGASIGPLISLGLAWRDWQVRRDADHFWFRQEGTFLLSTPVSIMAAFMYVLLVRWLPGASSAGESRAAGDKLR